MAYREGEEGLERPAFFHSILEEGKHTDEEARKCQEALERRLARRKFSAEERRLRAAKFAKIMRELTSVIFCNRCGTKIVRDKEDNQLWAKRRQCDNCRRSPGKKQLEAKHCLHCGQQMAKADFFAKGGDSRGWNTVAVYESCRDFPEKIARECKARLKAP